MELRIEHTWDGLPVSRDPVTTALKSYNAELLMPLSAPFNDPPGPVGVLGKPFRKLWDYEVVEAFFLSDRAEKDLEVQLCPHRLEFFQELNPKEVMGEDWKQPESDILKSQAN